MADLFSAPIIMFVTGALFIVIVVSLGTVDPVLKRVYKTGQILVA